MTGFPAGDGQAMITLNGARRPRPCALGAAFDRVVLHVTAAAIRSLLTRSCGLSPARGPA
jgi:hypothetical protein